MITSLLIWIAPGIPERKAVLLLADRGIETSPDLCRNVNAMGWHYLFRIAKQSKMINDNGEFTIYEQISPGDTWRAEVLFSRSAVVSRPMLMQSGLMGMMNPGPW